LRPSLAAQDTGFIFDNEGTTSFHNDYDEVLPSLNIRMELRDNLLLRLNAAKVITRPTLSNLLSSITSLDQGYQRESISRGNPKLSPFKATKFGASLEWYFDDSGAIFGSVFYKDMSNRVFNAQVRRTFPDENGTNPAVYASGGSMGQPIQVLVSQPQNTGDEKIKGLEIGIQKTFDDLPGFWSGFGLQANYTFLDSEAHYDENLVRKVFDEDSEGAENFLRNPPTQGQGLSENSYNIVVFYEQDAFSARLAYNWRDQYLLSPITGPNGWALYEKERGQLDGSISFTPREGLVMFMDATNILQEEFSRFWDNVGTVAFDKYFESMNYYGRTVTVGLRLRY
jgi:TonB-dependent receptor